MLARFVQPAAPTWRSTPPRGEQWLHEIKFDGWRIQLHKHGGSAAAFKMAMTTPIAGKSLMLTT
jgi:bifunctional non-homologous end joining protein LigD